MSLCRLMGTHCVCGYIKVYPRRCGSVLLGGVAIYWLWVYKNIPVRIDEVMLSDGYSLCLQVYKSIPAKV